MRRIIPYVVAPVFAFALAYIIIYEVLAKTSPTHAAQAQADSAADTSQDLSPQPVADTPSTLTTTPIDTPAPIAVPEATPGTTDVPDMIGMSVDDARQLLASRRLSIVVRYDTSSFQPPGTVLRHTPEGGRVVTTNTAVVVTASQFPPEQSSDSTRSGRTR